MIFKFWFELSNEFFQKGLIFECQTEENFNLTHKLNLIFGLNSSTNEHDKSTFVDLDSVFWGKGLYDHKKQGKSSIL